MPNYWTTMKSPLACWYITFPHVSVSKTEQLLGFTSRLLEAGEREGVYRILPENAQEDGAGYLWYLHHMEGELKSTGVLSLFSNDGRFGAGTIHTPGRIAYYDEANQIAEEEVNDLGELLIRLRPDLVNRHGLHICHVSPVEVSGLTIVDTTESEGEPVYIRIGISSDIWFPTLLGFHEENNLCDNSNNIFDNRNLASRHTPRLNRFLASVRKAAIEYGGEWGLADWTETDAHYGRMCRIDGIDL